MQYLNLGSVCVSGLTAAGKTTHCHLLAGEFGLTYVSASQILLSLAGISPIQARDFWFSDEARELWSDRMTRDVDAELRRLSQNGSGFVFDAVAMPWRAEGECLRVFFESDLKSRITKSMVSHRGRQPPCELEYARKITEKDRVLVDSHKRLFGIEVESDRKGFDLVLDISQAIQSPTFKAAIASIAIVHAILRPAVGYYLTRDSSLFAEYLAALERYRTHVVMERISNCPNHNDSNAQANPVFEVVNE